MGRIRSHQKLWRLVAGHGDKIIVHFFELLTTELRETRYLVCQERGWSALHCVALDGWYTKSRTDFDEGMQEGRTRELGQVTGCIVWPQRVEGMVDNLEEKVCRRNPHYMETCQRSTQRKGG